MNKILVLFLAIFSLAIITETSLPNIAIASPPPTQCQALSLFSGGPCPNPPPKGGNYISPAYVVDNGVTYAVYGPFPYAGGGAGGFFSGGQAGPQETGSIPQEDLSQAVNDSRSDVVVAVIYNGPTTNVSYTVLIYQPASATWYAVIGVNNSGLSISQLIALTKAANFLSSLKDLLKYEQNPPPPPTGGGGGPGGTPLKESFTLPTEVCSYTVAWNDNNPSEIYSEWVCTEIP